VRWLNNYQKLEARLEEICETNHAFLRPEEWTDASFSLRPRGLSHMEFLCMPGVFDSAGSRLARVFACALCGLPCCLTPSLPEHTISELNSQPTDTLVQRFKCNLTAALTWLGARVARYSFLVRLFHSLLHVGLSRRYPDTIVCATFSRN
jgi:hypothetical protein